jgi:LacI family transcriptional regulator
MQGIMGMNVTIKTIAQRAGVSAAAVSKALNGSADISAATKEKILSLCVELGYTRNQAARSLVTNRSSTLGLLIPDISTPIYPEIFKGLDAEAKKRGFRIFLCDTNRNISMEEDYVRILMEQRVQGIIIAPVSNDVDHIQQIVRGRVPILYIGGKVNDDMENYVATDNQMGSRLAISHLASLGHRLIAMICDNYGTKTKKDRIAGYRAEMEANGLDPWVVAGGSDHPEGMEYGYRMFRGLFDPSSHDALPTAIYTSSDMVALGVMKAAAELGIKIPHDVSLVGYDDIMFASLPTVMLTTVAQPRFELGRLAVDLLCKAMEPGLQGETHKATLEPKLVVRSTTRKIV